MNTQTLRHRPHLLAELEIELSSVHDCLARATVSRKPAETLEWLSAAATSLGLAQRYVRRLERAA